MLSLSTGSSTARDIIAVTCSPGCTQAGQSFHSRTLWGTIKSLGETPRLTGRLLPSSSCTWQASSLPDDCQDDGQEWNLRKHWASSVEMHSVTLSLAFGWALALPVQEPGIKLKAPEAHEGGDTLAGPREWGRRPFCLPGCVMRGMREPCVYQLPLEFLAYPLTCPPMCAHAHAHTHAHTPTCAHTHTHSPSHTHSHTHTELPVSQQEGPLPE